MCGPKAASYERRCFCFARLKCSIVIKLSIEKVWSTSYCVDQQKFHNLVLVLVVVPDKNIWLLFSHDHRDIFALVYVASVVCCGRETMASVHCSGEFLTCQNFIFEKIIFTWRVLLWKPIVCSAQEWCHVFLLHGKLTKLFLSVLKNANQIPQFAHALRSGIVRCLRTSWRFETPWVFSWDFLFGWGLPELLSSAGACLQLPGALWLMCARCHRAAAVEQHPMELQCASEKWGWFSELSGGSQWTGVWSQCVCKGSAKLPLLEHQILSCWRGEWLLYSSVQYFSSSFLVIPWSGSSAG